MSSLRNVAGAASVPLFLSLMLGVGTAGAQGDDPESESVDVITLPSEEPEAPPAPAPRSLLDDSVQRDTIEVTGSRIKGIDIEQAQPVLVLDRDDIDRTGLVSIGDLLQDLPQAGPALNTTFNNGGDGSTQVDLRTLGSERVLVLVNGRRWVGNVSSTSTNSVDLNTIPISIIERVEILKDGASAVYGSDAIAGVVNIITRRDIEDAQISSQIQITDEGDGFTQAHSFTLGSVSDRTTMALSLGYVEQEPIFAGDRAISAVPLFGTGVSRGSLGTPNGSFLFVPTPDNLARYGDEGCPRLDIVDLTASTDPGAGTPFAGQLPLIPGAPVDPLPNQLPLCILTLPEGADGSNPDNYRRFNQNTDAYNFAPDNYLLTPQERGNVFGQFFHTLTPDITLGGEFLYNRRRSAQELAAFPIFFGDLFGIPPFDLAYLDSMQEFNPFDQDVGRGDPAAGLVGFGAGGRRSIEGGPRNFSQTVETVRVGFGLEGASFLLDQTVNWDISIHSTESALREEQEGLYDYDRLALALGPPEDCAADADCVPVNLTGGQGTLTQEQLDYIQYTGVNRAKNRTQAVTGNVSLAGLYELPAGPLGLAAGFEARRMNFSDVPHALVQQGRSSTLARTPTIGSAEVIEGYAELAIPVLRAFDRVPYLPVQELDLSLAGRFTDNRELGSEFSGKFGLRYRPLEDLLVRGTLSEAFRAPSVTERFLGATQSFPIVNDPCSNYNSPDRDDERGIENVRQNCQGDGVPASYSQTTTQLSTTLGGNEDLFAETSQSITAGIIWNPEFVPGFTLNVDWYRIEIDDVVTFVTAADVLQFCYRADPEERALCDRVERNDDGSIGGLLQTFANLSRLKVSGVDIGVDYVLPLRDWFDTMGWFEGRDPGLFRLVFNSAYLMSRDEFARNADGGETRIGGVGRNLDGDFSIPRIKADLQLQWTRGPWNASGTLRYVHSVTELCDDGFQNSTGLLSPEDDPIPSLEDFGLCDGRADFLGAENTPINELPAQVYLDVQGGWRLPGVDGQLVLGIDNVLGNDPPVSTATFANSFDSVLHRLPDTVGYLRYVMNF